MNLTQLQDELRIVLNDPLVQSHFTTWLNEAVVELAYEYELPGLRLKLPGTLATTTANWQYLMSAVTPPTTGFTYMKNVFRVTNSDNEQGLRISRDTQVIDLIDPDHDETGTSVYRLAVEDDTDDATVSVYPKANDTLNLWYYRQPVAMSATTDVPDGIPAAFHRSVLIPKVVLKAMRLYPEFARDNAADNTNALRWWTGQLNAGLYGNGYQIGMVDALRKSHRPRIREGKIGGNVSGSERFLTF